MYGKGEGVPPDAAQAVVWTRKAAEQGLAKAQFNLGLMYANGQGVPQDDAQAVVWIRKAAEQGHAKAQFALGLSYDNGEGVPQDYQQAYAWFSVSAANGRTDGVKYRNLTAKRLSPTQLVEAQALATRYFEASRPKED
jgi:TPR repeat protein